MSMVKAIWKRSAICLFGPSFPLKNMSRRVVSSNDGRLNSSFIRLSLRMNTSPPRTRIAQRFQNSIYNKIKAHVALTLNDGLQMDLAHCA